MINQKPINELLNGDKIQHYFILSKIETRPTRTGKNFLNLELKDKTGSISAKKWDNFDGFFKEAKEGDIVKIVGSLEVFNNNPQIIVDQIAVARESSGVTAKDFLQKSKYPVEDLEQKLNEKIESVKNSYLNTLLKKIFSGDDYQKYINAPAGKAWHHSYIHGLLEHTLEIVGICELMSTFHKEINRDLLISGALLHDFGKTEELSQDVNFNYTDVGKLLGHIVIASIKVSKAIDEIEGFPVELKNQLIHLILSHQGKLEYASPVEPKTLEAIVLYQADELSAKTNAYKLAIDAERKSGNNWTKYIQLANTSLYIPEESEEDKFKENLFDN